MDPNNARQGGDLPQSSSPPQDNRSATANVLRAQISALYGNQPVASPSQSQQQLAQNSPQQQSPQPQGQTAVHQSNEPDNQSPYRRVHESHPQPQADQWKAYHTAWQNYYQKYYESYYAYRNQQQEKRREEETRQRIAQHISAASPKTDASTTSTSPQPTYFSQQPAQPETNDDELTRDRALTELREKLRSTVQTRAKKIRDSKHFVPIAAALSVILIFLFLQYNRVLIGAAYAYIAPGSIDPQNIVIEPTADAVVSSDPRLIIPKINVDVPVIYDVGSDYNSQMDAMQKGVAHFAIPGANSHPGEIGNTVLSGHSSNDLFDPGDYKFIFAQLDKLEKGDTIYANYQGKRYTYVVTKKEVVKPTEVSKLVYQTSVPVLTLITCTPLGTSLNRLLVTAEQISPDPAEATAAPSSDSDSDASSANIPGSSPTLLERLFGKKEN